MKWQSLCCYGFSLSGLPFWSFSVWRILTHCSRLSGSSPSLWSCLWHLWIQWSTLFLCIFHVIWDICLYFLIIHIEHNNKHWVGNIPWRRAWQPTPVFWPGESPWIEEPGGLQSMGSQRVGHAWETKCIIMFLSLLLGYVSFYFVSKCFYSTKWCSIIDVKWKFSFGQDIYSSRNVSFLPYSVIPGSQDLMCTHLAITDWLNDLTSIFTLGNSSPCQRAVKKNLYIECDVTMAIWKAWNYLFSLIDLCLSEV